jgi:hypothetical protein
VTLAAAVHHGLFAQLALGLENLDTTGFLGEKGVAGHTVPHGILMAMVGKGHRPGFTACQHHIVGPALLAFGQRQA